MSAENITQAIDLCAACFPYRCHFVRRIFTRLTNRLCTNENILT